MRSTPQRTGKEKKGKRKKKNGKRKKESNRRNPNVTQ
jgi:hypothetical protein